MKELSKLLGIMAIVASASLHAESSMEQVMGVSVNESGIMFQVSSNGCTYKRDFQFQVEERLENLSPMLPAYEHHYYITLERLRVDNCEAYVPFGTQIFFSFDELGINFGKYHVQNPIGGDMVVQSR